MDRIAAILLGLLYWLVGTGICYSTLVPVLGFAAESVLSGISIAGCIVGVWKITSRTNVQRSIGVMYVAMALSIFPSTLTLVLAVPCLIVASAYSSLVVTRRYDRTVHSEVLNMPPLFFAALGVTAPLIALHSFHAQFIPSLVFAATCSVITGFWYAFFNYQPSRDKWTVPRT